MDTQKDISIDISQSTTMVDINKKLQPVSFFEKDESFVFVYKKTEKLTTAVYMVTNLFSDSEPMKWNLRKKVSDLLSYTLGYKNVLESQHLEFVDGMKTSVLEIISLLEISSLSGLVSKMNFSIIEQEFIKLVSTFNKSGFGRKESFYNSLSESFFDVVNTPEKNANNPQNIQNSPRIVLSPVKDITHIPQQNVFTRTNRQNIILGLLKKKKDLTIKDIAQVIKNCSEKTIQRELVSLIILGILKKTGERRWSKYSLV